MLKYVQRSKKQKVEFISNGLDEKVIVVLDWVLEYTWVNWNQRTFFESASTENFRWSNLKFETKKKVFGRWLFSVYITNINFFQKLLLISFALTYLAKFVLLRGKRCFRRSSDVILAKRKLFFRADGKFCINFCLFMKFRDKQPLIVENN